MKKAYFYSEGSGMYAFGCKDPDEAVEIMRETYIDWDDPGMVAELYGFSLEAIQSEKIVEDRAYQHRKCGFTTIGESWCMECNEPTRGNGRKVFCINFV